MDHPEDKQIQAVVDYVLHNLYPDLGAEFRTHVEFLQEVLSNDRDSLKNLVRSLQVRDLSTFSIPSEIQNWKSMNQICNRALPQIAAMDPKHVGVISVFQNRINEYLQILADIHTLSSQRQRIIPLLVHAQPFLFMNALWDIAGEHPEIGLATYLEDTLRHIVAENGHLKRDFLRALDLKPRNATREIKILEKIKSEHEHADG